MRIKVNNQWFELGGTITNPDGKPEIINAIMVELTPGDKKNIINMHPDATKYAIFNDMDPGAFPKDKEAMIAWMNE